MGHTALRLPPLRIWPFQPDSAYAAQPYPAGALARSRPPVVALLTRPLPASVTRRGARCHRAPPQKVHRVHDILVPPLDIGFGFSVQSGSLGGMISAPGRCADGPGIPDDTGRVVTGGNQPMHTSVHAELPSCCVPLGCTHRHPSPRTGPARSQRIPALSCLTVAALPRSATFVLQLVGAVPLPDAAACLVRCFRRHTLWRQEPSTRGRRRSAVSGAIRDSGDNLGRQLTRAAARVPSSRARGACGKMRDGAP